MSLMPYNPFKEIEEWFGEVPRTPRADVYEKGKNIIAEVELPGVKTEDIKVDIEDNMLSIEAKSEKKKEKKEKGYYKRELSSGYYRRVLPLPVEVKENKADASYDQGVLKVVIPKKKEEKKERKSTKIKVKSKKKK